MNKAKLVCETNTPEIHNYLKTEFTAYCFNHNLTPSANPLYFEHGQWFAFATFEDEDLTFSVIDCQDMSGEFYSDFEEL